MRFLAYRTLSTSVVVTIWLLCIGLGVALFENYENTPGSVATGSPEWPTDGRLPFDPDRINIVMLAHPRCPCTRASLQALSRLLQEFPGRAATKVSFWTPLHASAEWFATDSWRLATEIRDVCVAADLEGADARRFGATTSGHVIVFAPDGRRLFAGGLTRGRGREGNSPGMEQVRQLLRRTTCEKNQMPVFGCSLFDTTHTCAEDGTQ